MRTLMLRGLGLLALSCTEKPAEPAGRDAGAATASEPAVAASAKPADDLTLALAQSCARATAEKRPLLLEFGADWCKDCRKLRAMKAEPPLVDELGHWETVEVDITSPDKHADLTALYDVKAIARWVVLRPTDCAAPIADWPRGPSRVVEPTSDGDATSAQLVAWLQSTRGS